MSKHVEPTQGSIWGWPPRGPALPQDAVPAPGLSAGAGPVQRAFWAAWGHLSQGVASLVLLFQVRGWCPVCPRGQGSSHPPPPGTWLPAALTSWPQAAWGPDLGSASLYPAWGSPRGVGEPHGRVPHSAPTSSEFLMSMNGPPRSCWGHCPTRPSKELPACVCCGSWSPCGPGGCPPCFPGAARPFGGRQASPRGSPWPRDGRSSQPGPGARAPCAGQVLASQAQGRAHGCHG